VAKLLRDHGIKVIGLGNDSYDARPFLRQIAKLTNTVAPKGGLPCKYGDEGKFIPAGQPVVCEDTVGTAKVVQRLLSSLPDIQKVSLGVARKSPVMRGLSSSLFPNVNVKDPFDTAFTATFSCVGLASGSYPVAINAGLRGYTVATTVATVNCGAPLIPPVPGKVDPVPAAQNPPGQPAPPPPAPGPPQPVTQAQAQAQALFNPPVGGASQEQEQLQLALAQAGLYMPDDDDEKVTQQAMTTRRGEERVAVALLAAAMASTSLAGLAMMRRQRAQHDTRTQPAWVRRP
jgi:hypothetical protein